MTTYTTTIRLAKPVYNAVGWGDTLNVNFDLIDTAISQSIFFVGYKGSWSLNTLYAVNDVTLDPTTSGVYKCLVQHTSPGSGTFSDARTANPSYWALQSTAEAASTAATASASAAAASAGLAATYAVTANTHSVNAFTYATNALGFATASNASAIAAAAAATAADNTVTNMRAIAILDVTAITDSDTVFIVPAGYIVGCYFFTKVAFTGGTVTIQLGTTFGGEEMVAPTSIAAAGVYSLAFKATYVPLMAPYGGGSVSIRITQSVPTAIGNGVLVVALVRA